MDNQHRHIFGYRDLDEGEIALINEIRHMGARVSELIDYIQGDLEPEEIDTPAAEDPDPNGDSYEPHMHNQGGPRFPNIDRRWLAIGVTDLQKGFMSLTRAVARPRGF